MPGASRIAPPFQQQDPTAIVRVGGWLFQRRSWLPLPLVVALLLVPGTPSSAAFTSGLAVVVAGELLRLWGVRHIGVVSRTRSDRLGPLVTSGPFGLVRNPLYIGNVLLWAGFAIAAGIFWIVPLFLALLGFEYHAIVRWEERLLELRLGDAYRSYAERIPRWIPGWRVALPPAPDGPGGGFSWRETFFSERGTLVAIVAGGALLWLKAGL